MVMRPDDLRQRMLTAEFRSQSQQSSAESVLATDLTGRYSAPLATIP
jgi:hypothetical protein